MITYRKVLRIGGRNIRVKLARKGRTIIIREAASGYTREIRNK